MNPSIKTSTKELRQLLVTHWCFNADKIKFINNGLSTKNWLIKKDNSFYILRNAGTYEYYVKYQIFLLQELVCNNFSYKIPKPINTGNKFYIKNDKYFFYFYEYVNLNSINYHFNDAQVINLAKMLANFHQTTNTIRYPKELRRKNIFKLIVLKKNIFKNYNISQKISNRQTSDRILIKYFTLINEAFTLIKHSEIKKYNLLPKIVCHSDWSEGNILSDKNGVLAGLIDFGGLFQEPRIFDIQNALKNILIKDGKISPTRIKKFINTYNKIHDITSIERNLLYPTMIADIITSLDWLFEKARDTKIPKTKFNKEIKVLKWLVKNKSKFINEIK